LTPDELRRDARHRLLDLLGDLPPEDGPVRAERIAREDRPLYTVEHLALHLDGMDPVPACFTIPHGLAGPAPAVVYNHAHGGDYALGKDELLRGRPSLKTPPYAEALASLGICALAIDARGFGERRGKSESELFKELLWQGKVLWGLMVYDTLRATGYLASRPEVDPGRIASMGMSMGSTMAWWHAALDERVKVCVDLCCLTDFQALIEARNLDGHGLYYYVPSLLKHFTTASINALICPRAHLSLAGNHDRLTPPAGLDRVDAELRRVYAEAGVPQRWRLARFDSGHLETQAMRAQVLAFLAEHLGG
jgi:hypothetical protein